MLRVLTFDDPRLLMLLRGGWFRSLGLRVVTACAPEALLERALFLAPDLVLVLAERVPPGFGRALRGCVGERRTEIVLVTAAGEPAPAGEWADYDGVVSLADPELELARLVSLQSRSRRRQSRRRVRLPVQLGAGGEALDGVALDLSADGAGLLLGRLPRDAGPQPARFSRGDGRVVTATARVVWADGRAEPAARVGVRLVDASAELDRALADLALWEVHLEGGAPVVRLHGELDERADLSPLAARAGEAPIIDLGDVVRASSAGLQQWSRLVRGFAPETRVRLRRVPAALMRQLLLVPLATLGCVVESYYAPFECEACEVDIDLVLDARATPAAQPCPLCGAPMTSHQPRLQLGAGA